MKAVVLAAGLGTRFFPITKSIPKEMLPLGTRPIISFIIEELIASGITHILIITSRRKKVLEDYLDADLWLEWSVPHKRDLIQPPQIEIAYIRQKAMRGTGDALLTAKPWIGQEPFIAVYPDDIHFGKIPLTKQLIKCYEKTGKTVLTKVYKEKQIERYGVLDFFEDNLHVRSMVEKPHPDFAPSHFVSVGRFLYTAEFLEKLEAAYHYHTKGEYYHLAGLLSLMKEKKVIAPPIEGEIWDLGEPEGYSLANLKYALQSPLHDKIIQTTKEYEKNIKKIEN